MSLLNRSKDTFSQFILIQNYLFDAGAEVALNKSVIDWESRTRNLELLIDKIDKLSLPIKNFILPGGTPISSHTHLSRTVCRRVERLFWEWNPKGELVNIGTYLNRLSDFLFVFARFENNKGREDILWKKSK